MQRINTVFRTMLSRRGIRPKRRVASASFFGAAFRVKPVSAFLRVALAAVMVSSACTPAYAISRIKDLVAIEGIRDNPLVGYGLVVGLNGTGDSLKNAPFTQLSIQTMLERLGVNTRGETMQTKNTAAVTLSANLPAFATPGSKIDVTVSAMGDAKSLQGGTLLVTTLMGADGKIYALAQGPVMVGGYTAQGQAASVTKNVPTSGRIPNGAVVERETGFSLAAAKSLRLSLRNPDLTTATRIAAAVNAYLGGSVATALDPGTVRLDIPANYAGGATGLLTDIEQIKVSPDRPATVVVNEQSGVVVMGADVRISTVAIAQGNLTIRVNETPLVSQPAPLSNGQTQVIPRTQLQVDEGSAARMVMMPEGVSLQKLVDGLNALGVGPRDIISILQAIKAAGALQAEIEVIS